MYISPTQGDAQYRLGEVTGRALPGTVNSQTDAQGRLLTRSLYNTVLKYKVWRVDRLVDTEEYYSVLWFPPFRPNSVKATSWKGAYIGDGGQTQMLSMGDYLSQAKAKRQEELDELNAKLIEAGEEVTQTEAEDTRLVKNASATNDSDKYYDTFDLNTFKAARASFTYRAPGFKAINDNINMIQCLLVRKDKLSLLVFLVLDEYLYSVANLQVGIVAEFAKRNDSVRLVANVNHYLTLVECDNGTFGYCLSSLKLSVPHAFCC